MDSYRFGNIFFITVTALQYYAKTISTNIPRSFAAVDRNVAVWKDSKRCTFLVGSLWFWNSTIGVYEDRFYCRSEPEGSSVSAIIWTLNRTVCGNSGMGKLYSATENTFP